MRAGSGFRCRSSSLARGDRSDRDRDLRPRFGEAKLFPVEGIIMAEPAVALNPVEAAALVDLPEGKVRKDVEHGFFGDRSPPRLPFAALVYLRVLRLLGVELGIEDRRRLLSSIRDALRASSTPEVVDLSAVLSLKLGPLVRELAERLDSFEAWKATLASRDDILGGEPVFAGSRLAVRRAGALAERGEPAESILADYPYLKPADIEFAKLYTRAYPRVGRPRETR
jgi:uncharacterized protein (DUF433 family)